VKSISSLIEIFALSEISAQEELKERGNFDTGEMSRQKIFLKKSITSITISLFTITNQKKSKDVGCSNPHSL
jgi:hypothetical protein